jgi:flagellum-specific ATP synthase
MAVYRDNEDLISIGAYKMGSNALVDRAIAMRANIEALLTQDTKTKFTYEVTLEQLLRLASSAGGSTTAATATTGTPAVNRA